MPDDSPIGESLTLHDRRPDHVEVVVLLEQVLAEVRGLRARLDERERIQLPRVHLRVAVPLLAEISASVGDMEWTARELLAEAVSDARLRAAIVIAVGQLDVGTTRRLGNLLSRCDRLTLPNRYRVERMDNGSADCATWRVLRV